MEEDKQDADGYDKAHAEEPDTEQRATDGAVVGELVIYYPPRDKPPNENARQERSGRQHNLSRQEVAKAHERLAEKLQLGDGSDAE